MFFSDLCYLCLSVAYQAASDQSITPSTAFASSATNCVLLVFNAQYRICSGTESEPTSSKATRAQLNDFECVITNHSRDNRKSLFNVMSLMFGCRGGRQSSCPNK